MSLSNSNALRQALRETYRADETQIVNSLIEKARFTPEEQRRIFERARGANHFYVDEAHPEWRAGGITDFRDGG